MPGATLDYGGAFEERPYPRERKVEFSARVLRIFLFPHQWFKILARSSLFVLKLHTQAD